MDQKLYSITKNKDDIIFLSDLRLNSRNQISGINDLNKKLGFYGYNLHYHSRKSSRGVGILISKKIKHSIFRTITDMDDNFLLIDIDLAGTRFTLGSIYGPNEDEMGFYDNLKKGITDLRNENIVIGGDWNATWDNSVANINIDIINMANIPSKNRSDKLRGICSDLKLQDPYRVFFPTRKEYTFISSGIQMLNRSRLDYFIVSEQVLYKTINCTIPHSLSSTVFDHKPVYMSTKRKRIIHKQVISDTVLDDPDLTNYVSVGVFECYLHHAVLNAALSLERKNDLLNSIGNVFLLLDEIRSLTSDSIEYVNNELGLMEIEGLRAEVTMLIDDLPDIQYFEALELNCSDDIFFEVLASCVKNVTLGQQAWSYKMRNKLKVTLSTQIKALKENFNNNVHDILILERRLSSIIETELRTELNKIKNFERLNNEKITPYFLKIAKSSKQDACLSDIKDNNGQHFGSDEERSEHITSYCEEIYKKPAADPISTQADIVNFLEDTATNPTVENSKLTDAEKTELESPITLLELEKSMSNSNMSSAPGTDGISNKFIKRFWNIFKTPLLKYANHCFFTGTLTDSFKGAKIRLIPKKGDISKIKNWRPISLLNCFYKILSRVLTNRLRKYIDKLTPIGQKGYSEKRQCQEVLISVSDCISKCNSRKVRGALLSLDISKAFDSLSHSFLNSVLLFFNFGENFIRWITLLATNRTACIILNENDTSRSFMLERGNAQGDTISPFLFILCYQILLFKLEYDLQIIGIIEEPALPAHLTPVPAQVSIQRGRVYAYADDGNIIVQMDLRSLSRIKRILADFGSIRGSFAMWKKPA